MCHPDSAACISLPCRSKCLRMSLQNSHRFLDCVRVIVELFMDDRNVSLDTHAGVPCTGKLQHEWRGRQPTTRQRPPVQCGRLSAPRIRMPVDSAMETIPWRTRETLFAGSGPPVVRDGRLHPPYVCGDQIGLNMVADANRLFFLSTKNEQLTPSWKRRLGK